MTDSISFLSSFQISLLELMCLENYPFNLNFHIHLHKCFVTYPYLFNLQSLSAEDLIFFYRYVYFLLFHFDSLEWSVLSVLSKEQL